MKYQLITTCLILLAIAHNALAQQWTGSTDTNGQIERNGNTKTNGLIFGRYGSAFLGDSNPYSIASVDSELHDLLLYGSGSATLNLRLYDGDLKFGVNTTPNAILYNSGNAFLNGKIGIGTTTLTDALNIHKEGLASMSMWTNTDKARLSFRVNGTGRDGFITYQNDGRLSFNLDGTNASNVDTNEYMTILPNGKVGVGASTPLTQFQIMEPTSGGSPSGTTPTQGILISGNSTGGALNMGIDATGTFYSWIQSRNRSNADVYSLSLNPSGGNVGIGTTTPSQKLTVKGTVYSTEVKVDVNAGTGPDYVFEPTYNLPTLAETEAYIKANKHLPEVPSAKEMEANGINLSEMNMLLLKKVEELTLHLIEANKRIEKLEEKQK